MSAREQCLVGFRKNKEIIVWTGLFYVSHFNLNPMLFKLQNAGACHIFANYLPSGL
jgi:hypothetical protein